MKSVIDIRLGEKNYKYLFKKKSAPILGAVYIILTPNIVFSDIFKFLNLTVICEKTMNNKFTYRYDFSIFKGKKSLKVGTIVVINDKHKLNTFMNNFNFIYAKLIEEDSMKYLSSKDIINRNNMLRENLKKMLFLYFYHFDLDFNEYYDLICETVFNVEFYFKFNISKNHMSKSLLSGYNSDTSLFNQYIDDNCVILTTSSLEEDNFLEDFFFENKLYNEDLKSLDYFVNDNDFKNNKVNYNNFKNSKLNLVKKNTYLLDK